jgi:hypothetical protein
MTVRKQRGKAILQAEGAVADCAYKLKVILHTIGRGGHWPGHESDLLKLQRSLKAAEMKLARLDAAELKDAAKLAKQKAVKSVHASQSPGKPMPCVPCTRTELTSRIEGKQ